MLLKKIGKRIKEARKAQGITQAELAQKTDLTAKYLSNIECGEKLPKLDTFILIANALNVDANTLLMDVLDHTPSLSHTVFSDKFLSLPKEEQKRLLLLFDAMVECVLADL